MITKGNGVFLPSSSAKSLVMGGAIIIIHGMASNLAGDFSILLSTCRSPHNVHSYNDVMEFVKFIGGKFKTSTLHPPCTIITVNKVYKI
jgi:hypothetical protein